MIYLNRNCAALPAANHVGATLRVACVSSYIETHEKRLKLIRVNIINFLIASLLKNKHVNKCFNPFSEI